MKRIFIALVLLVSFCFLTETFAKDICTDPRLSETAGKDESIILAKVSAECAEACEAERDSCKNTCTETNMDCQKACGHDESCIYSCGTTHRKCADGCLYKYEKCILKCPRYYDGRTS